MVQVLDRNIKDLMGQWPAVESALAAFNIGCVTCGLGTCRLRDIIEIHNLSVDQERRLFEKIAAIVYPGQDVRISALPRKAAHSGGAKKLSPPMQMLVDEHVAIKRVVAAVPAICAAYDPVVESSRNLVQATIEFIRGYADRFHHAKEKDILFGLFTENTEIIDTMRAEHEVGRGHIGKARQGLTEGDRIAVGENLHAWAHLLAEHIRKEDEILFPWMDRLLSDKQVGSLYAEFREVEQGFGDTVTQFVRFSERVS
jgi:hemerythrin-like domain-containing protein